MEKMQNEPPIAQCAFGWGRKFRLYENYLDINGTCYPLSDLAQLHPTYHSLMGIPSVRLELRFGKKKVIMRGIAVTRDAQKVIEYLTSQYLGLSASSKGWIRTRETEEPGKIEPETSLSFKEYRSLSPREMSRNERAQAFTDKVETPGRLRFRHDQRERRQRRLQVERSLREHGFDVEKLARRLQEETLPEVTVPLRLLPGEQAHYSMDATLSGEPIGGPIRYTYPARDHGKLILTNKRLIYIGRKSQVVLDYARLLHVSRLRGAIAFQAEHWYRREIFEVHRSLECAMYLECILERFQQEQELQAIPGGYLDYNDQFEETSRTTDIDTMPLSRRNWDVAEILDPMDTY